MIKRKTAKPAETRKRTFCLSTDTMMKIAVEAERRGVSKSACASAILDDYLRRVVIQDRGRQSGETDPDAQTAPALTVRTG